MFLQQKMCIWSFKISMQLNIKRNISCGFVCGFYFYFGERGDTAYDGLPHKSQCTHEHYRPQLDNKDHDIECVTF